MTEHVVNEIEHIGLCQCGAITVTIKGKDYSMTPKHFEERYGFTINDTIWCNCNSCVNHWSIEMCACGSGEPYDECEEGHEMCGTPMQIIGGHTHVNAAESLGGYMDELAKRNR